MFVIIQARTSSKRLPQKVINNFAGKPMILWTCARIQQAKNVTSMMIATSDDPSDDPLAKLAKEHNILLFRGSLDPVSDRFMDLLKQHPQPAFMRISGDSPLIDPDIVDHAVDIYSKTQCDMVTNVHPRSFPKGQSVEILRTETYLDAVSKFATPDHKEHVTSYFYENDDQYNIINVDCEQKCNHIQLSVDTVSDHNKLERMVGSLGYEKLNLASMIEAYENI